MPCEVFLSPCDVRLDKDNYTMVQPDLLAVCGENDEEIEIRYEGAPDLVVEILSPSSRSKDQVLKLYKYHNAGVREYWIIDPKYKTVTVHRFEDEDYTPQVYKFESQIPVGISQGKCTIDFSRVGVRPFR
jgi:Uma2 family endonuclease